MLSTYFIFLEINAWSRTFWVRWRCHDVLCASHFLADSIVVRTVPIGTCNAIEVGWGPNWQCYFCFEMMSSLILIHFLILLLNVCLSVLLLCFCMFFSFFLWASLPEIKLIDWLIIIITQWGIITGLVSFKRHNLVSIQFIYMEIQEIWLRKYWFCRSEHNVSFI